jgi:hypothetical protein
MVLFFATAGFIAHLINPAARPGKLPPEIPFKLFFANEGLSSFVVLLATWIMAKIERRGRSYGFGGTRKFSQLFAGMGTGILLISLLVLILRAGGWLVIDSRLIFGGGILRYGLLWLIGFFLVGVNEESTTRGYLLFTLTRGLTRYFFLRRAGLDVVLCFGMGRHDTEVLAHCWLVKNGEPFLEAEDPRPLYVEMYRISREGGRGPAFANACHSPTLSNP